MLLQPKSKRMRGSSSSPPEGSGWRILHANQFFSTNQCNCNNGIQHLRNKKKTWALPQAYITPKGLYMFPCFPENVCKISLAYINLLKTWETWSRINNNNWLNHELITDVIITWSRLETAIGWATAEWAELPLPELNRELKFVEHVAVLITCLPKAERPAQ